MNPDTVARRMGDEIVLINLKTNRIYSLNRTAARLWELLSAGNQVADIEKIMFEEFDVTETLIKDEIQRLITSLVDENFISPLL